MRAYGTGLSRSTQAAVQAGGVLASAAGVVVVWKSYFSPFTSTGPVYYGLMVFIAVLVLTVVILAFLRVRGREDWMHRAQLVFEQSGGH